jgi:hypothetical protein
VRDAWIAAMTRDLTQRQVVDQPTPEWTMVGRQRTTEASRAVRLGTARDAY